MTGSFKIPKMDCVMYHNLVFSNWQRIKKMGSNTKLFGQKCTRKHHQCGNLEQFRQTKLFDQECTLGSGGLRSFLNSRYKTS